jgi:C4-dicarboxylate transporter/malic acid transport protein
MAAAPSATLFHHLESPADAVRHFTPNWFAATMGTGVVAVILGRFPVAHGLGQALWLLDIGLFSLFSVIYGTRWLRYPREALRVIDHPVMSMFLGCIPMGLATIINGFLIYGPDLIGPLAVQAAAALWPADALLALACGLLVPLAMFTRQSHGIERMTAVWLLPLVAAEVTAASGALLLPHLADPGLRLDLLTASYVLWACSVPAALGVIVILFLRMAIHKLPESAMAATNWLALGPVGTGALALLALGQAAPSILADSGLATLGVAVSGASILGGLLLWGYGLWWVAMATLVTAREIRKGLPFNLGWWAYIFPLGVFTLATLKLGDILRIAALAHLGATLAACLVGIWIVVAVRTARGAWTGALFNAPCLAE